MISTEIKDMVRQLDSFDQAMLIEFIYDNLDKHEDEEVLKSWVIESEKRLDAVNKGKLKLKDYNEIRSKLR